MRSGSVRIVVRRPPDQSAVGWPATAACSWPARPVPGPGFISWIEPFRASTRDRVSVVNLLREIRSAGRTVFVVHHDLSTEYFDWVTLLNVRVIASGPTTDTTSENIATYGTIAGRTHEMGSAAYPPLLGGPFRQYFRQLCSSFNSSSTPIRWLTGDRGTALHFNSTLQGRLRKNGRSGSHPH